MSRRRVASLEAEKNGLEAKYHRSQETSALDNQRSKTDSYVYDLPRLDKINVLLLPENRKMELFGSKVGRLFVRISKPICPQAGGQRGRCSSTICGLDPLDCGPTTKIDQHRSTIF